MLETLATCYGSFPFCIAKYNGFIVQLGAVMRHIGCQPLLNSTDLTDEEEECYGSEDTHTVQENGPRKLMKSTATLVKAHISMMNCTSHKEGK